ncbi:thiamine pyrophosphate-dependent dehydrogenase E1 component subunit alpha [Stomatohabitans albus]|uniref:thiamine pyrophosphate-dependent dehydrogenase E1 component subunit alpha n=1 Tax=Stomatohabitans albus TaxID=3110766 RepID=UPI00300D91D6
MSRIDNPASTKGAEQALETMWTIRSFESGLEELFQRGMLHGTMHLSIGQEASATGACGALEPGDQITSTHRGHGHCLGHGASPERMMAELLGKETGYCAGRGGSMHIADVANGNLGANGIVAGSLTIAAGAAFALRQQHRENVVLCFFGDGATNEGSFHESLNFASLHKLPVIYLCENNLYGMSTSIDRSTAGGSVASRAEAYRMDGQVIDGNDLLAVWEAVRAARQRAIDGLGPTLIEAQTYRYRGHSKSDRNLYRTRDEINDWRDNRDPIERFSVQAINAGWLNEHECEEIQKRAEVTIRDAIRIAHNAPDTPVSGLDGATYAKDIRHG